MYSVLSINSTKRGHNDRHMDMKTIFEIQNCFS